MNVSVFVNGEQVPEEEINKLQITTPAINQIFTTAVQRASGEQ